MYIFNQERDTIMNTDKCFYLTVENFEVVAREKNVIYVLGEYDEYETALEVLRKLAEIIASNSVQLVYMPDRDGVFKE